MSPRCWYEWIQQKKMPRGGLQPVRDQIHSAGDLTSSLCLTLKQNFPLRAIYFIADSFPIVFIIRPREVFHSLFVTIWDCTSFENVYRISSFKFCISGHHLFWWKDQKEVCRLSTETVNRFCVNNCKEEIAAVKTNLLPLENFPWPRFGCFICLLSLL